MALCTFDGWVGYSGGETLLRTGDEWPDDHALVREKPDMFEVEQAPEPPAPVEPPVQPERKKPGPKPGSSRAKPQT